MHLSLDTGPAVFTSVGSAALTALNGIKNTAAMHVGAGHNPVVIYTFGSMLSALASCTGYPLWIAAPGSSWPGVGPWTRGVKTNPFWQFGGGGAAHGGDPDAFDGDVAALAAWHASFLPSAKTYATQPTAVKGTAKYTNASIAWSGEKNVSSYWVDLVDGVTGVHLNRAALSSSATSYRWGHLKEKHRYSVGVYARPGVPGSASQFVKVTTE
jgi:hypothetical protein